MNAWLLQNTSFLSALTAAHFLLLRQNKVSKENEVSAKLKGDPSLRALRVPAEQAISEEPLELAICYRQIASNKRAS